MPRIRFDFGTLTLDAELMDTPTAKAVLAALPVTSGVLTWGEEVYFDVPVTVVREAAGPRGGDTGRDRLLAGGSGDCHRVRAHADLQGGRDAGSQAPATSLPARSAT